MITSSTVDYSKAINFTEFLDKLIDFPIDKKRTVTAKINETKPLFGLDYDIAKDLYNNGIEELKKWFFITRQDAKMALRAVIERAFNSTSSLREKRANPRDESSNTYYYCWKSGVDRKLNIPEMEKYFGEDSKSFDEKCKWSATLNKFENGFKFTAIKDLCFHCYNCFNAKPHTSQDLLNLAKSYNNLDGFLKFNELISKKLGFIISRNSIYQSRRYETKKILDEGLKKYSAYADLSNLEIASLKYSEDIAILGALAYLKKAEPEFEYEYLISKISGESVLTYVAMMWPNQKDALQKYGDLILVDSTFNVNIRHYNAITLVVVDNKLNSLLGAIAFVRNEFEENYQRFLEFVKEKTPQPRRLPLCLISDSAPQIHSGVPAAIPYCKHIHCAFHLLKDQSLFGSTSGLTDEKKKEIRSTILLMLISRSLNK